MIAVAPDRAIADVLTKAAKGDVRAQDALTTLAFAQVEAGSVSAAHGLAVAEAWARLAASHGGSAERLRLAGVLLLMAGMAEQHGQADHSFHAQVEAVAIISDLADEGHEEAARQLQMHAHEVTPQVLAGANRWLREDAAHSAGEA